MGWEFGTHSCGHDFEKQMYGSHKSREARVENMAREKCPDCQQEEIEEVNKKLALISKDKGLPVLTGSAKQINWAEVLRTKAIKELDRVASETKAAIMSGDAPESLGEKVLEFIGRVKSKPAASFWIDNRGENFGNGWIGRNFMKSPESF